MLPKPFHYAQLVMRHVEPADWPQVALQRLNLSRRPIRMRGGGTVGRPTYAYLALKERATRAPAPQVGAGVYLWKVPMPSGERALYATEEQMSELALEFLADGDAFARIYTPVLGDARGLSVLDIGGFVGDSALYFLERGARRVVVYEPVEGNVAIIRANLQAHASRTSVVPKAVSDRDGQLEIRSETAPGTLGFGYSEKGNESNQAPVRFACAAIGGILTSERFDLVKMDCEGCETCLLGVPAKQLRQVPYWIIETHNAQITRDIAAYFEKAGFGMAKTFEISPRISLMHFALKV